MFEKMISLGMICGLVACAPEQRVREDKADLRAGKSAAEQDASASVQPAHQPSTRDNPPAATANAGAFADAGAAGAAYPGKGFIVHEWGTNTVVVSSDGKLQRGLHHEEEDLPAFVYDALAEGEFLPYPPSGKMETPVDYFYSDQPRSVTVSVAMPNGLLTQWYPAVHEFAPYDVPGALTITESTPVAGGRLDWSNVEILARDVPFSPQLPEAPLERFTWSYARDVAANTIRVKNPSGRSPEGLLLSEPQSERFLFYRGLGNFALPVDVAEGSAQDVGVVLSNRSPWPLRGPVFLLDVRKDTGAFVTFDAALSPSAQLAGGTIWDAEPLPLDVFVDALDVAMTNALLGTGLYRDEAVAMVRTWRRQWFRTPGFRVLYFAPTEWIDREVPITISPAPDTLLRVMVLRVEVLRRGMEDADLKFVAGLDGGEHHAMCESYFRALGRFAEPRLRRALENLGTVTPEAASFLASIQRPNASFALTE